MFKGAKENNHVLATHRSVLTEQSKNYRHLMSSAGSPFLKFFLEVADCFVPSVSHNSEFPPASTQFFFATSGWPSAIRRTNDATESVPSSLRGDPFFSQVRNAWNKNQGTQGLDEISRKRFVGMTTTCGQMRPNLSHPSAL